MRVSARSSARGGLIFNEVEPGPFRARLPEVYAKGKEKLGVECWTLLEENVGKLG